VAELRSYVNRSSAIDVVWERSSRPNENLPAELTQTDQIDWKIPLPARPIGGLMVSSDLGRQFAALKRLLEAQ
jgi:hypothetical protein